MFEPGRGLGIGRFEAVSFPPSYRGKLMLNRISAGFLIFVVCLVFSGSVALCNGPQTQALPTAPKAAYHSMLKSTTPFNCQELAWLISATLVIPHGPTLLLTGTYGLESRNRPVGCDLVLV
jgi:hypothetical protein